jgi:hypothetical protein
MSCRRSRFALAVCVVLAVPLVTADRAAAQEESALEQIVTLNQKALVAYRARKHEQARQLLLDAEMLAETNGLLFSEMAAYTYLNLGMVHLQGLNQRERALRYFALALKIRPYLTIPREYYRGNLARALREARRRQKQLLAPPAPPPPPAAVAQAGKEEGKGVGKDGKSVGKDVSKDVGKDKESGSPASTAAAAPAAEDDPDVEKPDERLYCAVPPEAPPGEEMEVRCRAAAELRSERAFLFYRSAGQKDFTAVRMTRDGKDDFAAAIPAANVTGNQLEYYVEAEEAAGHVTASQGEEATPKVVTLRKGAPPAGRLSLADMRGSSALLTGGEPPPAEIEASARRRPRSGDTLRRGGRFFVGLSLGTGLGAHLGRNLEHHVGKKVEGGLAYSAMAHVMPEIGIQYDERLAFSLQSRHQYIPASGGPDMAVMGKPPRSAHALFARVYYELWGGERLQVVGTGTLGGGSGFRLKIGPVPQSGVIQSDTITGGPLVIGPGAALYVNLTQKMLAVVEGRMLIGYDRFAVLGEGSLGVQYTF